MRAGNVTKFGWDSGILILNHNQVLIHLQEVEMLQYVGVGRQGNNQR